MVGIGRPGPEPKLATLYAELDDGGREMFDMLMDDPEWSELKLAAAFTELGAQKNLGLKITRNQVSHWRRGDARRPEAV